MVELETDKVTIEVPAPAAGVLAAIAANPGDTVNVGALIGAITEGAAAAAKPAEAKPAARRRPRRSPRRPRCGSRRPMAAPRRRRRPLPPR